MPHKFLDRRPAQKKGACRVCKQLRYFLVAAAVLLALMWMQPEWRLPRGIDYNVLLGDLFLWAFIGLFAFKYWQYRRSLQRSSDQDAEANWRPPTPEEFKIHRDQLERRRRDTRDF